MIFQKFYKSTAIFLFILAYSTSSYSDNTTLKPKPNQLEEKLINALSLDKTTNKRKRLGNSGKAIQAYIKEGALRKKPTTRINYTDYWKIKGNNSYFMGHRLLVIEEEYMTKDIGCCVDPGIGITVRVMRDTSSLKRFASENACSFTYEIDKKIKKLIRAKSSYKYAYLSCRDSNIRSSAKKDDPDITGNYYCLGCNGYLQIKEARKGYYFVDLSVAGGSCGGEVDINDKVIPLKNGVLTASYKNEEEKEECLQSISFNKNGGAVITDSCYPEDNGSTCSTLGEYQKENNSQADSSYDNKDKVEKKGNTPIEKDITDLSGLTEKEKKAYKEGVASAYKRVSELYIIYSPQNVKTICEGNIKANMNRIHGSIVNSKGASLIEMCTSIIEARAKKHFSEIASGVVPAQNCTEKMYADNYNLATLIPEYVDISYKPFIDEKGKLVSFSGIINNISGDEIFITNEESLSSAVLIVSDRDKLLRPGNIALNKKVFGVGIRLEPMEAIMHNTLDGKDRSITITKIDVLCLH